MSVTEILYTILISPLQLFFEILYMLVNNAIDNPGLSIIVLSLSMNFLVLPLYKKADLMQEEERIMENKLRKGVNHIKKTFKGDEKMMILQTYYRQNNYKPTDVFKGSISLFLEIPFFIAAYNFLSHLQILNGVSFGIIEDLGLPDSLIQVGNFNINILPILMTSINLISCVIFTKGYPTKTKVQLYTMAIFFLIFLYNSPSGLVFYWTLNNTFSLVKTIFYKLKNPKKVLVNMFGIIGILVLGLSILFYHPEQAVYGKVLDIIAIGCTIPFILSLKSDDGKKVKVKHIQNNKMFWAGAIYLVSLVGLIIPSTLVAASPQEFVDINNYLNPAWFVVSALCFAIGLFMVWIGVFYWLAGDDNRHYFDKGIWVACGIATTNYMFFGRKLGVISKYLQYDNGIQFSNTEKIVNILVVIVIIVVCALLYKYCKKLILQVLVIASIALVVMSVINFKTINSAMDDLQGSVEAVQNSEEPSFTLSKEGKNVIVFMLDRAMSEYVPYILNEKPELKEKYSGFTYYANTVSFGAYTNFGSPALYGGYEYTPVEMNKRDTEPLVDKHNEALKVMPVLFDQNNYDVTVCDPTYANYQWTPDLSIYDEYPDIRKFNTNGYFNNKESRESKVKNNKRNFFCFALMKSCPIFVQPVVYANGNYNNGTKESTDTQSAIDNTFAYGESGTFNNAYKVLENLPTMTKVKEKGNTFLMISNDTTHEPTLLQEPEYVPSENVDNREYESANSNRFTLDGQTLKVDSIEKMGHYDVNMAALIQIGNWIDYLKENGVYDNTKIIIVADHGRGLYQLDGKYLDDGSDSTYDTEFYYPLLMVKDFDATEFNVSDEFMTNADVATIATSGTIDNPVNPFTGKTINNDEKTAHDQYILGSQLFDVNENCGNKYLSGIWFSVHDDMRNMENWSILQTDSTSPFEKSN